MDSASASASANAFNSSALSVASGKYPVAVVTTTGAANPLAAYVSPTSSATRLFYVKNFGTVAIKAFTLSVTGTNSATFVIRRCSIGANFTAVNTCSDALTPVTISAGALTLSIASGATQSLQFAPSKSTVATVSVSVSTSQVRAPVVTNS
ncbi:MAG: hypothetical protein NTX12_05335 [Actinobacteria bacterium]|nr:hypothetical protein [Actinomycetota bacterium]